VLILPYLEESERFAQYDLKKVFTDPQNVALTSQPVANYLCPSMALPRAVPDIACGECLGPGSYIISAGTDVSNPSSMLDGAFVNPREVGNGNYSLAFKNITDGTSKTFLFGEMDYGIREYPWERCGSQNGTPRWGDQTWADGYWYDAWGHLNWRIYEMGGRPFYNRSSFTPDDMSTFTRILRVFRSDHPGGSQFAYVDGSVHFIPTEVEYPVLRALVTRAGDEVVDVPE
jgi:prepilin-type processing-associated H-X9-DG protein